MRRLRDLGSPILMRLLRECGRGISFWFFMKGGLFRCFFSLLFYFLFWVFLTLRHSVLLTLWEIISTIRHWIFALLYFGLLDRNFCLTLSGSSIVLLEDRGIPEQLPDSDRLACYCPI